ncbi:MAG TPA: DUF2938 domain-containing protein [Ignavibacteria bacterium]|mgnify:CR=1 FL=1|nr:DUF2938 domain-containing protein [Ignavibacteria bacterium]HMQ99381.1 DUF2938 domain-containing protein [Ignavibacteria bacterium]
MVNIAYILINTVIIGIGATITFDLWAQLLKLLFKIPPSNICVVGRWLLHMPRGIFRHSNIIKSPEKKGECLAGWIAHYMIGITLAAIFIVIAGESWISNPSVIPALLFGIVTVAAPFFIMQPAFGFGFAASKTPHPMQARLRSLLNHAAFGVGLYLSAILVNSKF